ncbi:glycosyltransferase family 4 protein [Aestuariivivens sediminis]|uniref:glycosyltransferase family 4 protein n=1 Tax=Aestuariivivens sediminis TaxID=2913557 RepID=UPI001F57A547|nr:glycosyltransferase family 4 protein [Aestuariivivens sediminis]
MKSILYIGNNLGGAGRTLTGISELGPLLEQDGFKLRYASCKRQRILRLLDMLVACLKWRNRVDYVLIDTYSTLNFWYAVLVSQLCRGLKLSYIPILHGGNLESRLKHNPRSCRLLLKYAYKSIAPSLFLKTTFARYGYNQVTHIPNSLSLANYPFETRPLHHLNILWVRSFSSIYNPQLAVRILRSIKDQGLAATLCMVGPDSGDGSFESTKQLAKALQVHVTFTGKLPKVEWVTRSKAYNLFINTTHVDNMPVSVIEAMALGLPVVSTNVGGMPYLIEHGTDGLLVDPDDTDGFVEAIKQLRSNPGLLKHITQKARQKAESFDWSIVKKQWRNVLK